MAAAARHLHAEGAQAEDEHRVHDDVDDGPGALGEHGVEGAPGCLEQPFEHDFQEQPEGQAAADAHIGGAGGDDIGDIGLYGDEGWARVSPATVKTSVESTAKNTPFPPRGWRHHSSSPQAAERKAFTPTPVPTPTAIIKF